MKNQFLLKALLLAQTLALVCYTALTFHNEGAGLFQVFLSNVAALGWNGQFNLDFSCYLTLSGLWIMWRNKFSSLSIAGGIAAAILGIIVFAPYLLYVLFKEEGDLKKMLLGDR
jgi:uncharacterized membrane protein